MCPNVTAYKTASSIGKRLVQGRSACRKSDPSIEENPLSNTFRNVLRLSTGDFVARALNFLAFVYLARILGVNTFGMLEFAGSILTYLLLLADGGLELWGTREAAKVPDVIELASRVIPLRLLLATASFLLLLVTLPLFSPYPGVRTLLVLYALSLFPQAVNLKWIFMGQEKMVWVARGLVVAQALFAVAVFVFIHRPEAVIWVPVLRLASDSGLAGFFAVLTARTQGRLPLAITLRGALKTLRPAVTIGASQAMGLLNYNFDLVLLGFLRGATLVGWYSAAYKPVSIFLALPLTYFTGLFPALSRSYEHDREEFLLLIRRSAQLWLTLVVPVVVGGMMLARPVILFLYGEKYTESALPFQILVWSAALVSLRWSYMDALRATGFQHLDLRCAIVSASTNVVLNLLLIPRYGMVGAASATVAADVVWFVLASYYFRTAVQLQEPLPPVKGPLIAGLVMGVFLWLAQPVFWIARALVAVLLYFLALALWDRAAIRTASQFVREADK